MKGIFSHILILVLAAYLSIVGCGVSIQHYCCEECHHHHGLCCHHHHHTAACGFEFGQSGHHCGVLHLKGVLDNLPEHHHFIPPVTESFAIVSTSPVESQKVFQDTNSQIEEHAPPIILGRDILTLKSSYLI